MTDATRRPQEGANFKDRIGQRFGKLVVVRRAEDLPQPYVRKNGRPYSPEVQWLCTCDCGSERVVPVGRLRSGEVKSCGCYKYDPRPNYRFKNPLPSGRAARNRVFKQYRLSAGYRGLSWELADGEFDDLTSQNCTYCGCPPSTVIRSEGRDSGAFTYNGLDRKDNTIGYVAANVLPCCSVCNHAKKDMSYDQFMARVARLATFQLRAAGLNPCA